MVAAYTTPIVNFAVKCAGGMEAGLRNRDFAYWLNGAAVLTAFVASIYFPVAGGVALTAIGTMYANATAFDFATFALVDAPAELGGTLSAISVSAAIFFFTDITGFVPLATQFFAYTPSASVAGALALIGTASAVLGTTWKWMRMDEISETQRIDRQRLESAREASSADGISQAQMGAWERKVEWKYSLDWCRFAIWTVTSTLGVVSQRFAETGNVVLAGAAHRLPLSGMRIMADGARGFLAVIGYYLGRGTMGTVLSPRLNADGKPIADAYEVRALPGKSAEGRDQRAAARDKVSFWSLNGAQWISGDRMLTRDVLKVARVGMKVLSFTMLAASAIPSFEGLAGVAGGIDALSNWMKEQYTFTKLVSLPAATKKLLTQGGKNFELTAKSASFWGGVAFDWMYNVAAIPLYVTKCSRGGIVLPSTVKWLLTESTKRWCALAQGVGIAAEIAGNVNGSQDKLLRGAERIWAGDFSDGDALYTIDMVAKIVLTGATLAQWASPFGAFGTVMLVVDGVKAGVGLYKKSWDASKPEGAFPAYLLEKQWKSQGAPAIAVA